MGAQRALGRRPRSAAELDAALLALVDRVTGRMRGAGRVGRTVTLRLRFADFTRATRSRTLARPTAETALVAAAARALLAAAGPLIAERGITLIGVAVANLDHILGEQLILPFDRTGEPAADRRRFDGTLDGTLDAVAVRYGRRAVTRAVLLGRDDGEPVPLLPD
jgi:DNA polymerase-4